MNVTILPKRLPVKLAVRRSSSTQAEANAKLAAFRQVVHARKSVKRFQPNLEVPGGMWRDILRMTLVRCCIEYNFLDGYCPQLL